MNTIMIFNIVFNIVVTNGVDLWGLINHLQILFHYTGINVPGVPSNAMLMNSAIVGFT